MTDAAPAPATPGAPAVASELLKGPDPASLAAIEQARAQIETLKSDRAFYERLKKGDAQAAKEWSDAHKAAYPPPPAITSEADVGQQAAARNAQAWGEYIGAMKQAFDVTPQQEAEMRNGVIDAKLHERALAEKDRLIKDVEWRTRFFKGSREAGAQWRMIQSMLALRPVQGQR